MAVDEPIPGKRPPLRSLRNTEPSFMAGINSANGVRDLGSPPATMSSETAKKVPYIGTRVATDRTTSVYAMDETREIFESTSTKVTLPADFLNIQEYQKKIYVKRGPNEYREYQAMERITDRDGEAIVLKDKGRVIGKMQTIEASPNYWPNIKKAYPPLVISPLKRG